MPVSLEITPKNVQNRPEIGDFSTFFDFLKDCLYDSNWTLAQPLYFQREQYVCVFSKISCLFAQKFSEKSQIVDSLCKCMRSAASPLSLKSREKWDPFGLAKTCAILKQLNYWSGSLCGRKKVSQKTKGDYHTVKFETAKKACSGKTHQKHFAPKGNVETQSVWLHCFRTPSDDS